MARQFAILVSGVLFGAGLTLGGMTDPARVRGFLDLFGNWDPTLAFVMGGAVLVMAVAWWFQPKLARPLFSEAFALPTRRDLTPKLIFGSALFGIGWGVAGFCPGAAIPALGTGRWEVVLFIGAVIAGLALRRALARMTPSGLPQ